LLHRGFRSVFGEAAASGEMQSPKPTNWVVPRLLQKWARVGPEDGNGKKITKNRPAV
jgi:hypothetical protein